MVSMDTVFRGRKLRKSESASGVSGGGVLGGIDGLEMVLMLAFTEGTE